MALPTPPYPIRLSTAHLAVRADPLHLVPDETAAIATHWRAASVANPRLWNGSAFLFRKVDVDPGTNALAAEAAATNFATYLYWRSRRGFAGLTHMFPVGAVVTADDRLIVGRMSVHTANAGRHYPPAGSFDASDLMIGADGTRTLDIDGNIMREIAEETGLDVSGLTADPDLLLFPSSPHSFALIRRFRSPATSNDVAPGLARHIAEDPHKELDAIVFTDFAHRFDPGEAEPYVNDLLAYLAATG